MRWTVAEDVLIWAARQQCSVTSNLQHWITPY